MESKWLWSRILRLYRIWSPPFSLNWMRIPIPELWIFPVLKVLKGILEVPAGLEISGLQDSMPKMPSRPLFLARKGFLDPLEILAPRVWQDLRDWMPMRPMSRS